MQENLSPQQSLDIIQSMIDKTKSDISENRFYFLMWGWLVFIGFFGQFFLKVILNYEYHYAIWLIVVIGAVISIIKSTINDKKRKVRTYISDSMGFLWTGMGISFFVLGFVFSFMDVKPVGWIIAYPVFILLYGLGTFVSGKILQFQPLVIGGIINWILACVTVFFHFDYQMLFAAAAIVASYIIPGYLLNKPKTNGRKRNF